jgi:hypothetical protein
MDYDKIRAKANLSGKEEGADAWLKHLPFVASETQSSQ